MSDWKRALVYRSGNIVIGWPENSGSVYLHYSQDKNLDLEILETGLKIDAPTIKQEPHPFTEWCRACFDVGPNDTLFASWFVESSEEVVNTLVEAVEALYDRKEGGTVTTEDLVRTVLHTQAATMVLTPSKDGWSASDEEIHAAWNAIEISEHPSIPKNIVALAVSAAHNVFAERTERGLVNLKFVEALDARRRAADVDAIGDTAEKLGELAEQRLLELGEAETKLANARAALTLDKLEELVRIASVEGEQALGYEIGILFGDSDA